jgi:hypothetical protein
MCGNDLPATRPRRVHINRFRIRVEGKRGFGGPIYAFGETFPPHVAVEEAEGVGLGGVAVGGVVDLEGSQWVSW